MSNLKEAGNAIQDEWWRLGFLMVVVAALTAPCVDVHLPLSLVQLAIPVFRLFHILHAGQFIVVPNTEVTVLMTV